MNIGMSSPGMGTPFFTQANQFIWGGPRAQVIEMGFQIDSSAVDAGSSNTKYLRAGLAMGKITATGLLKQFDNAAVDGTQNLVGFLKEETPLIDSMGRTMTNGAMVPVVIVAPVKAKNVLILGVTLIGIASEAAIRTKIRARCLIDDEI